MTNLPDSVEKEIEIDATPEECYRVAADLAGYKDWAGGVEKVDVLETGDGGLATKAEFSVGAFGQTLDYVLAYEHDLPRRVAWKAVSGSVKELLGSYTFEDIGDGRTRVQYKLAIDPGFNVPSMIKKPATKLIVSTALNELRKHTEKPATKEAYALAIAEAAASAASSAASVSASAATPAAAEAAPAAVATGITVDMTNLPDSVEKEIEIDATPEECYRVAADLAGYKDWAGGVEKVDVLETGDGGLATKAEFSVGAFGQTLDYVLAYEHDLPRRVAWKAVSGSVKELLGSYTFEDIGDGRTRVQYKLAIDPGFNVPSMIKKPATKLIVSTALNELRKHTEKPATKAALKASKGG
mgnify:CR=1 FL=1